MISPLQGTSSIIQNRLICRPTMAKQIAKANTAIASALTSAPEYQYCKSLNTLTECVRLVFLVQLSWWYNWGPSLIKRVTLALYCTLTLKIQSTIDSFTHCVVRSVCDTAVHLLYNYSSMFGSVSLNKRICQRKKNVNVKGDFTAWVKHMLLIYQIRR